MSAKKIAGKIKTCTINILGINASPGKAPPKAKKAR
jgi:hypothetical protein